MFNLLKKHFTSFTEDEKLEEQNEAFSLRL